MPRKKLLKLILNCCFHKVRKHFSLCNENNNEKIATADATVNETVAGDGTVNEIYDIILNLSLMFTSSNEEVLELPQPPIYYAFSYFKTAVVISLKTPQNGFTFCK